MFNSSLKLMLSRMGEINLPQIINKDDINNNMATRLNASGGYSQQDRMIRDKRKNLDRAVLYSYQGAKVKKDNEDNQVRALINPNKVKQDYDDKIISIGYEYGYKPGDVFEWCNTGTHWLIYLQDLTELAYFKGDIRKCSYQIEWDDGEGERHSSYIALEGPTEKILQTSAKHGISIDSPNYSISFMIPKNKSTIEYFQRYQKFYLQNTDNTCWRVEAVNSVSIPGIIKVSAMEYYANKFEDDIKEGIAGSLIIKPVDPNPQPQDIIGETFIKPKKEYIYFINNKDIKGTWSVFDGQKPVELNSFINELGNTSVRVKWNSNYSGQFNLQYKLDEKTYTKTIIVESLF